MAFNFFPSYNKAGKGVDKNEPKKRGFFAFFELMGRKFWKMITLNLLYVLFCLPFLAVVFVAAGFISSSVVNMWGLSGGAENAAAAALIDLYIRFIISFMFMMFWGMGPSTAGFSYILRNYAREEHAWLWSDFWQNFKSNFVQGIVVWIIDVVMMVVLYTAFMYYGNMPAPMSVLRYLVFLLIIAYTFIHFYIYQMMVTFKMTLRELYKNSLIFAVGNFPCSLRIFVILLVTFAALLTVAALPGPALFAVLAILVCIAYSFWGFVVNFNVEHKLHEYTLMSDAELKKEEK